MIGHVDDSGRALVAVSIQPLAKAPAHDLEAWIDTGFNGDLVVPKRTVQDLALAKSATVEATLADGSIVELSTYSCLINWFGEQRKLEVVANDGKYPLLGIGLLRGLDLRISYRTGELMIE